MRLTLYCKQLPDELRKLMRGQTGDLKAAVQVTGKTEGGEYDGDETITFEVIGEVISVEDVRGDGTNKGFQESATYAMRTHGTHG